MDINLEYVSRAKQGDAQSFAMLYDQVAKDLYRVALYTLGNPQDAEDVVSETFLEAVSYTHLVVIINTCAFIEDAKRESIENILEFCELKRQGVIKACLLYTSRCV